MVLGYVWPVPRDAMEVPPALHSLQPLEVTAAVVVHSIMKVMHIIVLV